jgi:A/G-specific adenine glycosylase
MGIVRHAYTHFKVAVHAFRAELLAEPQGENLRWARLAELEDYPMGKIDRQIARKLG